MSEIILFSLLIILVSVSGIVLTWRGAGKIIEENLRFLVSFSAGVFLIVAYQLAQESLEHASSITNGLGWIFAGVLGILLLFKLLPNFHHHHDEHEEEHPHSKLDARRILISDGIHNIADGILLASSFAVNKSLGILTAIGILIHELVQEISEFFVLRQAGYSSKQALKVNILVSSTILIGSIGGFLLINRFGSLETPLLGLAAGSFLVVVFHDLIPHSVRESNRRTEYSKHILWFALGIFLMISLNSFTATSHTTESPKELNQQQTEL